MRPLPAKKTTVSRSEAGPVTLVLEVSAGIEVMVVTAKVKCVHTGEKALDRSIRQLEMRQYQVSKLAKTHKTRSTTNHAFKMTTIKHQTVKNLPNSNKLQQLKNKADKTHLFHMSHSHIQLKLPSL